MSDRLTQKELRDWSIMAWDDTHIKCQMCGEHSTGLPSKPEHHRPGCPCDKGNVVVSRELLRDMLVQVFGDDCPDGTTICKYHDALRAALGEEPAP